MAPVLAAGAPNGSVCVEDAAANGLTLVDLSDTWTPRVFAIDPETHDAPEYREKYLALASQPSADLGLYGIAPNVSLVARRLGDEARRACDAGVDLAAIAALRSDLAAAPDARAASALLRSPARKPAIIAVQTELACAGFMKKAAVSGVMGPSTQIGLDAFRRRHMIVGAGLDDATLGALALGGDELELCALLRVLRERVAEAAGLIEDGSASETRAKVADRDLDFSRFAPRVEEALPGGAPDLVDEATDAAARALGWTSPDAARAFFAERGKDGAKGLTVALALPPPPAYHSAAMELRVEIDRGDVFYELPGQAAVAKKKAGVLRGPTFVVYAKDGEIERPLIRWATTIGGWKKERTEDGEVGLKYKGSDVGDRVWRQIIAAPAWMPPDSTPETDLLHETKDGTFALKQDLIQPGYRNAYGLVMLIHDEVVQKGSETRFVDHGIRTHGSVDYRSIQRGESHGCHRLYNQLALRLSGYLLAHRTHVRKGKMRAGYHRTLEHEGETVEVDVPTRGYLYELDPPVPVHVLEGRIAGERQKPMSSVIPLATDHDKG
ncbi:MAG TPA: hypothetical protein VL400_10015 [Polyangiaceae bacterium]|nr:hypothetical protein [Polyangiaceae bacterium]